MEVRYEESDWVEERLVDVLRVGVEVVAQDVSRCCCFWLWFCFDFPMLCHSSFQVAEVRGHRENGILVNGIMVKGLKT